MSQEEQRATILGERRRATYFKLSNVIELVMPVHDFANCEFSIRLNQPDASWRYVEEFEGDIEKNIPPSVGHYVVTIPMSKAFFLNTERINGRQRWTNEDLRHACRGIVATMLNERMPTFPTKQEFDDIGKCIWEDHCTMFSNVRLVFPTRQQRQAQAQRFSSFANDWRKSIVLRARN